MHRQAVAHRFDGAPPIRLCSAGGEANGAGAEDRVEAAEGAVEEEEPETPDSKRRRLEAAAAMADEFKEQVWLFWEWAWGRRLGGWQECKSGRMLTGL